MPRFWFRLCGALNHASFHAFAETIMQSTVSQRGRSPGLVRRLAPRFHEALILLSGDSQSVASLRLALGAVTHHAAMQRAICARIVASCSAVIRDSVALTIRERELDVTCAETA
jgi:hypothetical protein